MKTKKCPKCKGLGGYPKCGTCQNKLVVKAEADDRLPHTPRSRFFIAQPGDPVKPHCDQQWTKWEVGDQRGQDRICLTSCKRKAELIRDALEAFHEHTK
jgi:hypothetical protein